MRNVMSDRILAKDITVSNDTWVTGVNNNDLIVGPSGSGKTQGYVIPNILHTSDNMIITDTKGNLFRLYGGYLRKNGYKVMNIDFTDTRHSPYGYNPLKYIRECHDEELNKNNDYYEEQDVKKVAMALCPIQTDDPYWDMAAQMYVEAIILFVLNWLPERKHNLCEVYSFLTKMGDEEFRDMLEEECLAHPNSAFTRKFKMVNQNRKAEKMDSSIKGIVAQHLDVVSYAGTKHMFQMEEQVDLEDFVRGKTVLFLNVSDSERTQDAFINLFYTQSLQYLMKAADKQPDSRLPIPVRYIMDDFSTNTVIPDFDKIISVIRSREIYVSIVIQSISQLEGLYERAKAQTIINNCDHCLYLGGVDVDTADYFAKKFNCQPSTILNLPLDSMFLFTRGSEPRKVLRYELRSDEVYCSLEKERRESDSDGVREFH